MFTIVTVNNGSVSNSFAKIADSDGNAHEWFTVSAINLTCNSIGRTGRRCAVGNMSGNRCEADGRSRGREFDPSPLP